MSRPDPFDIFAPQPNAQQQKPSLPQPAPTNSSMKSTGMSMPIQPSLEGVNPFDELCAPSDPPQSGPLKGQLAPGV